ncbi:putative tripartite tricarboxylate transporter, TctB family [Variovorax paradoxus B4]|uniref:Putative tripartite tricarboxylate transporter, TctB family n=1 Tax=Variovorax paradoxus B4 TaxID=1246301 RepID=T1XAC7_VARPD|nr:tripartite tricarboxylate transporter TctB family protein [Variovorax paradoxus]AGU49503.1 putative tripartite tricarboxylate transporter, TctB family [Variovorax paradoxus B4]
MKFNDAIFGAILLALGIVVLAVVQGYPGIPGQQVGPALFPGLLAIGLCICGAMLLAKGGRERHAVAWVRLGDWAASPRHVLAAALVIGAVLFYIFASERLGFLPTAAISLLALMLAMRVPPGRALLIALIATLVIHTAFYKLLRVPLPWGVLTPIAW